MRPKLQPHPVTQERLKELLTYNPCTGKFYWKVSRQGSPVWKPAGCLDTFNGYRRLTVDGITYMASRLAWLYVYGEHPQIVDHIDQVRCHDSIWNLTNGTQSDNIRSSVRHRYRKDSPTHPYKFRRSQWQISRRS